MVPNGYYLVQVTQDCMWEFIAPEKPYAKIVSVDAPSEAVAGDTVTISVTVENTSPDMHGTMVCTGQYDSTLIPEPDSQGVPPGDQAIFEMIFTMPGYDVSGTIWSWHIEDSDWIDDDDQGFNISLATITHDFTINTPEVQVV